MDDPGRAFARIVGAAGTALLLGAAPAPAAVFEVNSVADNPDIAPGNGVCDIGAGLGICTLRAAIEESNARANAGGVADRIEFEIAPIGAHTIEPLSELPTITEAVVIDGTTQTGWVPNTDPDAFNAFLAIEIDGTTLGPGTGTGLTVEGPDVVIRGLAIRHFGSGVSFGGFVLPTVGEHGRLEGCVIEDNAFTGVSVATNGNVIGGGVPVSANVVSGNGGSGIEVSDPDAAGNLVNGNLVGTDAAGGAVNANGGSSFGQAGIADYGTGTLILRNLVSGQYQGPGILAGGVGGIVQNNRVGTNKSGTVAIGNFEGISVSGTGYLIGGTQTQGNVIAGNEQRGIGLSRAATVQGNFIGATRITHSDVGNIGPGIEIAADDSLIGGPFFANRGNVIHHNQSGGVIVLSGERNRISANSMFRNGGQFFPGIDLALPVLGYVTVNDPGDADEGPNRLQNFPVLDAAVRDVNLSHVEGSFDSAPGDYTVQVYASRVCHATGHGEGEQLLGERPLTLPGDETFAFDFAVGAIGPIFTAISTDADGNTSEWSPCLAVAGGATADLGVAKAVVGGDVQDPDEPIEFEITLTNPGPLSAIDPVVTDTLPAGMTFQSADPVPTSVAGNTITWELATLDPNDVETLIVTASVDAGALVPDLPCGRYKNVFENRVAVESAQLDLDAENDEATVSVTVRTGSDLKLDFSPHHQSAEPPTTASLTVTAINDGPEDVTGVTAYGTDPGIVCASAAPHFDTCDPVTGEWTWQVGDLGDGETRSLDFEIVAMPFVGRDAVVTGIVEPFDAQCTNNLGSAVVFAGVAADLEVLPFEPDDVFTVTIRNNGPDAIASYVLEASASTTLLSLVLPGCDNVPSCRVTRPGLGPGEEDPLTFGVLERSTAVVSMSVTPRGDDAGTPYDAPDPNPGNNSRYESREVRATCGLGNAELVLLLPVGMAWLARRRRRRGRS